MIKLNCIAVDDEPLALEYIAKHISKFEQFNLVAKCKNVSVAEKTIAEQKIDLVFLDIQMPGKTGIELAKILPTQIMVIFTTAYEKFALEGFDVNAVDYLLKPIEFERFKAASNKAIELFNLKNYTKPNEGFIIVKSEYQTFKLLFSDILFIEGLKDYVKIYVSNQVKPILSRQNLKTFESQLPSHLFFRIHKSFIIPIEKITSVTKSTILINEKEFPLGETYKENFLKQYFKV
ncbi:MAG: response regulator [Bacteroidota bacterium]|nr:response regulator [Bacteroidota bacterium]